MDEAQTWTPTCDECAREMETEHLGSQIIWQCPDCGVLLAAA